jgi:hypothetical protein
MGGVGLDHYWAAGGECRCCVPSRYRKSEWEIGGAEDRHWPDRHLPKAQVRARDGLTVRQSRVDAQGEPVAPSDDLREQSQLPNGTPALSLQTWARKSCFAHRRFDQLVADCQDCVGYRFEKSGAVLKRCLAIGIEGGHGRSAQALDIVARCSGKSKLEL